MTTRSPIQACHRFARNAGRERAFALPISMIVSVILMVIGLALLETSRLESVRSAKDMQSVQALAAAEIGMARACAMAESQSSAWSVMTYNGSSLVFMSSTDPMYQGHAICNLFSSVPVGGDVNATYSVVIEDLTGWLPTSGHYRVHSFGNAGTHSQHITVDATTVTYASFGWLTDSENGVWFANGDVVDGWVYTNDRLNIWGSPTFKGKVNSAASSLRYAHGGPPRDNPDFQGGLTLNSPPIDIGAIMNNGHITVIRDRAQEANGIWLGPNGGRPYKVIFNPNGTVTIKKKRRSGWKTVVNNKALSSTNGAIYIEDTVQVKGKLDGEVTLATPENKDIQIIGDLVYTYPPNKKNVFKDTFDPEDPQFDNRLGLIAGRDVVVKKTGRSDAYIMASIAAINGSFRNHYYWRRPSKTLHIYGGLAQKTRGPVGMIGGRGYVKDYKYDIRYRTEPPPHFPTISYDHSAWKLNP